MLALPDFEGGKGTEKQAETDGETQKLSESRSQLLNILLSHIGVKGQLHLTPLTPDPAQRLNSHPQIGSNIFKRYAVGQCALRF